MSERIENYEDLPKINLRLGESEYEASPLNTTLFTFLGKLAMYDHIFFEQEETDDGATGVYLFNQHASYEKIAPFLVDQNFPMVLNRIDVPDCDLEAFDRIIKQSTGDLDERPEWLQ